MKAAKGDDCIDNNVDVSKIQKYDLKGIIDFLKNQSDQIKKKWFWQFLRELFFILN